MHCGAVVLAGATTCCIRRFNVARAGRVSSANATGGFMVCLTLSQRACPTVYVASNHRKSSTANRL